MAALDEIADSILSIKIYMNTLGSEHTQTFRELVKEINYISRILKHSHNVHAHPCCHTFNGEVGSRKHHNRFFFECKDKCFDRNHYPDDVATRPELLLREMTANQDCDSNGLVFIKDFLFNPKDNKVPKVLKAVQRIEIKQNIVKPRLNWSDYLRTTPKDLYV